MQKTRNAQTIFLKRNETSVLQVWFSFKYANTFGNYPEKRLFLQSWYLRCFYGTKRKLFTYGEYKLAANNLFKTKKTNFFKRAKLASKTLKENCSKREKYCMLSNLNNVNFFLPYQFWTLFSLTTCSNIIVLDNFCLVYILV